MNAFCLRNIQKNKLLFIILLVVFSFLSVYMPHGFIETHEHQDFENFFKQAINNSKPVIKLRKWHNKLRTIIFKIFRVIQVLSSIDEKINTRLLLFNMFFSKVSILHLFSILCCYIHGSKYKQCIKHSEMLPLMGV